VSSCTITITLRQHQIKRGHAFQLITSEVLLGFSLFSDRKQGHLIIDMTTYSAYINYAK